MNVTITQPVTPGQQIRPGKLNDAIKAVATKPFTGRHDPATVIVDYDPADDAVIRSAIAAHLATDWASQDAAAAAAAASEDTAIAGATYGTIQPATLSQLKAMDNTAFGVWYDANVTNAPQPAAAAIALLKLLTRIIVRRVL